MKKKNPSERMNIYISFIVGKKNGDLIRNLSVDDYKIEDDISWTFLI